MNYTKYESTHPIHILHSMDSKLVKKDCMMWNKFKNTEHRGSTQPIHTYIYSVYYGNEGASFRVRFLTQTLAVGNGVSCGFPQFFLVR
jgi:hypothetical protein